MARRIEKTPACIEMRLPQTTRERLSRPRSSVPSGFAQVGALRTLAQSVRSGSVVAIHGAPRAIDAKNRTMTPPTAAAGRAAGGPPALRRAPSAAPPPSRRQDSPGRAPDADTRIQHGVGDVHQQV